MTYEHYKDSGIDWIGEIPEHWEVNKLKYFSNIKSITNRVEEELLSVYLDKGVINFSDVDAKRTNVTSLDLRKYQLVEVGDFVLNNQQAWRGSVGVSRYKGIVSPAYIVLDLNDNFNSSFANYFFRDKNMTSNYLINSKGVGTIQRNLYWPSLKEVFIYCPPIHEQEAIANFLDDKTAKIDALVQTKEQQIEKLKELRQAKIHHAVTKGLPLGFDSAQPANGVEMKDSGIDWIGQIPEHWEVKKIKHLAIIKSGEAIINSQLKGIGKYEVFGGNGFMGYYDKYNVKGKSIIIGRVGALCGNVRYIEDKKWISDNALILKLINEIYYRFLFFTLKAGDLNKLNTSNAQPLITGTKVLNFSISLPPIQEQEQIVAYLDEVTGKIDQAIAQKQDQISKLKEYKQSLINEVVTGKVKVCG